MTTINNYKVTLALDASGLVQGAKLARGEFQKIQRSLSDMQTPAEKLELSINRLEKQITSIKTQKPTADLSAFEEMLRRLYVRYDDVTGAEAKRTQAMKAEENELNRLIGLENNLEKAYSRTRTQIELQENEIRKLEADMAQLAKAGHTENLKKYSDALHRMYENLEWISGGQTKFLANLKAQDDELNRQIKLEQDAAKYLAKLTTVQEDYAATRADLYRLKVAGQFSDQEYRALVKLTRAKFEEATADKELIARQQQLNSIIERHTPKVDQLRSQYNLLKHEYDNLAKSSRALGSEEDALRLKIERTMKSISNQMMEIERPKVGAIAPAASPLAGLGSRVAGFFAARAGVSAISNLASEADKANISLRQTESILQAISGSDIQGSALLNDLRQLTRQMPIGFSAAAEAAKSMMAYGFSTKEVVPIIRQLGMITAGNTERFKMLANAVSQMRGANRLMGQEVIQAVNSGWNPLAEISRNTGKSMSVLKKEMEEGKISFDMVAKALETATSATGRFGNVSSKIMDTVAGKQALLASKWEESLVQMGRAFEPLSMAIKDFSVKALEGLNPVVEQMSQVLFSFDSFRSKALGTEKMDLGKTFFGQDSAIARLGNVFDFYSMLFSGSSITKGRGGKIQFATTGTVEEMSKNKELMSLVERMQKDFINRQLLSNEHIAAYNLSLKRQTEEKEKQNRLADRQAAIEKQRNATTAAQAAEQEKIDEKFEKTINKYKTRLEELKEGQVAAQMMKADMAGFNAEQMKAARFWAQSVATEEKKLKLAKENEKANQRIVDTFERYNKKYETSAEKIGRETADIEELFMRGKISKQQRDEIQKRIFQENLTRDTQDVKLPRAMERGSAEFVNYMNTLKASGKTRQEQILEAQQEIQKAQRDLQQKMLSELQEANKNKVQKAR